MTRSEEACLRRIADIAHTSANGGLKVAGKRETVGQLKAVLREIRNMAQKELAS